MRRRRLLVVVAYRTACFARYLAYAFGTGTTLDEAAQRYHDIVAACVARPGCTDITIWGVSDQYSWLNSKTNTCVDSGAPRPLL